MKKFLAMLMAAAMMISMLTAIAIVPASAIDGEWIVYSKADHYTEDFSGDIMSIPGYEYTEDGLRVIPADWRDFTPGAGVQTKEKVDIKNGVYMEVRVDEFSNNSDFWFNFNIWSKPMFKAGKTDVEKWGYGVQELIRSNAQYSSWRCEWSVAGFQSKGSTNIDAANTPVADDGCLYFTFKVTWNGSSYAVSINNSAAPQGVVDYMNETYGKDSEAYIGFNLQNGTKGGKCGITVLKFGTNENDAVAPMGDDSREPENFYLTISEIADPNTVEAGKPAIYMNGNRAGSDVKQIPEAAGGTSSINDDYSIHIVASTSTPYLGMGVANDVSYAIEDFPVAMVVVRDLCTCGEGECYALESANMYMMTGDITAASGDCKVNELNMPESPYVIDGHSYLYFFYDFSDEGTPFEAKGRFNSLRIDFTGVDVSTAGANTFDVCFGAMFRSVEEAEAYAEAYFTELGWVEETEAPTTEAPTEEATEVVTEAPEATTEAPADATEAPAGNETDAPAKKSGCGSVVGFGAIAIVAVAAVAGMVSFKKKD